MAEYKLCRNGEARTEGYVFSVNSKDDPMLLALKEDIKRHNAYAREHLRECRKQDKAHALAGMKHWPIKRVSLMGRGPRVSAAEKAGLSKYAFYQSIPHEHATYFDVYVGTDCYNQYKFREQLEKDLTPGQQKKLNDVEREIWEFKWKKHDELIDAGLNAIYKDGKKVYVGEAAYEEHLEERWG